MELSETFHAAIRVLARQYRDQILEEQGRFSAQMSEINAVQTSTFPLGLLRISSKHATEFIRDATAEISTIQDLSTQEAFDLALQSISVAAGQLMSVGSRLALNPVLMGIEDKSRSSIGERLEGEVRDRLMVARDRQALNQRQPTMESVVLFLEANPDSPFHLDTNTELREVSQAIRAAKFRDRFRLIPEVAVRVQDVFRAINQHRPHVIHFAGHGNNECLALLDGQGQAKPFDGQVMADLLASNGDDVKLVIFNACYSLVQVEKILGIVPQVIGTISTLDDDVALIFSRSFYGAVASGRPFETAFTQAKLQIGAEKGPGFADVYEMKSAKAG